MAQYNYDIIMLQEEEIFHIKAADVRIGCFFEERVDEYTRERIDYLVEYLK